ncbi:recombinase family protein [Companilactobacillus sp. HBUAS59699]|uniref:recombinase family protein n=1 Tax=Companilactobacillus sp. HBUAS59699 TaxID=3109358 RepID=UPI002FEE6F4E
MSEDNIEVLIGYVRVSTIEDRQKLGFEAQKRILKDNNVDYIYSEKISGRKDDRPQFRKAIKKCKKLSQSGADVTFVVVKLDRVSRKMSSLLNILEDLKENNISFRSINENIDTTSATGILMMQLLAMFSEFEVNTLRTRTKEALRQAKLDGKILGRPSYNENIRQKVVSMYRNPDLTVKEVAEKCNVSERTVYRIAKDNKLSRSFKNGASYLD